MTCIKTGANVFFEHIHEIAHGDLHKIGDVYIFKYVEASRRMAKKGDKYALSIDAGLAWDKYFYQSSNETICIHEDICGPFNYKMEWEV